MEMTVRPIHPDEIGQFIESLTTGFLERQNVTAIAEELQPLWDLERTWGAFDGGAIRGTFRSWPTELTVPGGGLVAGSAIAAVTVQPTHRRRGLLRAMAAAEHAAMSERGEVVGLLYSAEYPIYGRLGYGPATGLATWTLDAARAGFVTPPPSGVELVAPDSVTREAMSELFERIRPQRTGEIRRRDYRWEFDLGRATAWGDPWKGFVALRRDASGAVDGFVRYHADEKWVDRQPRYTVVVDELQAASDEAYAALWRFLADVDLVAVVKAEHRSPDEQLPWLLTNARAATASELGDALWVRLHDLPRALAARRYESAARLVLEVVDPADGRSQRVALDAGPDGAVCVASTEGPHLTLRLDALGAAYLGGTRLRDAVIAAGWDEHRPGALAVADRLFRTIDAPWCSTFF